MQLNIINNIKKNRKNIREQIIFLTIDINKTRYQSKKKQARIKLLFWKQS